MNKKIREWLLACSDDENVVSLEDVAPSIIANPTVCDTVFELLNNKGKSGYTEYVVLSWDVRNDGALILSYDSTM